jgi:hypothetical protein
MANAIDLTLAATVAADLGVAADATIDRVVTAASRAIATYCGRAFEKATGVVEYPAGYGRPHLVLDRAPILAITSIVEFGSTLSASEYTFEGNLANAGMVFRRGGAAWARTAQDAGRITPQFDYVQGQSTSDGIVVTYDAGFVTPGQKAANGALTVSVPEDLQEAANMVAVNLYKRRTLDQTLAAESLGDWSVTYRAALPALLGPDVVALLAPYVRYRVS